MSCRAQAYCKACYGKLFGAKGYGAGACLFESAATRQLEPGVLELTRFVDGVTPRTGGALVGEYRPRATPPSSPQKGPPTPARPTPAPVPIPSFSAGSPRYVPPPPSLTSAPSSTTTRRPLPTPPVPAPKPPSIPARPSFGGGAGPAPAPSIPVVTLPLGSYPRDFSSGQLDSDSSNSYRPRGSGNAPPPAPDFDEDDTRSRTVSAPALPPAPPASITNTSSPHLSPDLCPRCHTVVYHAEAVSALSRKWHKRCLRCAGCGTTLMPNRLDERDGEPWCRKCYTDKFGLKGGMGVMSVSFSGPRGVLPFAASHERPADAERRMLTPYG